MRTLQEVKKPEVRSQESEVAGGKKDLPKFFTPAPGTFEFLTSTSDS